MTRILNASPQIWQSLISEYLLKFQIKNLKTILLGKIADLDPDLIKTYLNWDVEDILGTRKIIDMLLTQRTPREIQYTLRNSRYGSILREGLTHYFNEKDPLYFQIYLDRYYYTNLLSQNFGLPRQQTDLIRRYINIEAEYQNVRMINRCLSNNFDPRIINELLVPSNFILKPEQYAQLIASRTADNMKKQYVALLGKEKQNKFLKENPVLKSFTYFVREFYARLQLQPIPLTESLELRTLDEILKILKFSEYTIYHLTRTLLRIMHHTQFTEEIID